MWNSSPPININSPRRWFTCFERESKLMAGWSLCVIPYPIDADRSKPIERGAAREILGVSTDLRLVLFSAMGGGKNKRKGFDLLQRALSHLRGGRVAFELLVFGESRPKDPPDLGFPIHYAGHLHDDLSLRGLYSAADVFVLPSRQDNLPNTGIEAMACGTSVVAFNVGGLPDIVQHQETGWLACPFDTEDLASGIEFVVSDSDRHNHTPLEGDGDCKIFELRDCREVSRVLSEGSGVVGLHGFRATCLFPVFPIQFVKNFASG